MAKIFIDLNDTVATWRSKSNQLVDLIGDLSNLVTTEDSDIVGAMNALQSSFDAIVVDDIESDLGNRVDLNTVTRLSFQEAINELVARADSSETDVQAFRADINTLVTDRGTMSSLNTGNQSSLVAAINEVHDDVGTLTSLSTTDKTSIVAAINEVFGRIVDIYDQDGNLLN